MSDKSHIEWTDATWSPVTGCIKVSQGCKHCYAEREVETRWSKNPKSIWFGRTFTDVRTHPHQYLQPLFWRKPRRIFVCPRADLFHEDVPDDALDEIFATMMMAQQHTFQVLTKRLERAEQWFARGRLGDNTPSRVLALAETLMNLDRPPEWPLPNVWIGVSIEDQATAEERIPVLLDIPAAVRWISAEPLLAPVSFRWATWVDRERMHREYGREHHLDGLRGINWVVAGGESGPNARPIHPQWARDLRDQCAAAGVPFLFKQWGEWAPGECVGTKRGRVATATWWSGRWDFAAADLARHDEHRDDEPDLYRIGKRRAGRLLDGVLHDEYPR